MVPLSPRAVNECKNGHMEDSGLACLQGQQELKRTKDIQMYTYLLSPHRAAYTRLSSFYIFLQEVRSLDHMKEGAL